MAMAPCGLISRPVAVSAPSGAAWSLAAGVASRTMARTICSSTSRTGTAAASASRLSSGWSLVHRAVRNSSWARSGRWVSRERMAWGPSTRNRSCLRRAERPVRAATFRTRGERVEVIGSWSGRSVIASYCAMSGCRRVDVLWQGVLRDLDQTGERRGVVDGELGEHAAIDLDAGQVQTLDEAVVGHAV